MILSDLSKHKLNSKIINELNWISDVTDKLTRDQCIYMLNNPDKYILQHRICNCCGVKKMLNLFVSCNGRYKRRCLICKSSKIVLDFNALEIENELNIAPTIFKKITAESFDLDQKNTINTILHMFNSLEESKKNEVLG